MANEGLLMLALGGFALFALFRKPNGGPANGGQANGAQWEMSPYRGGGSLDDFAQAETRAADEASGVGKGFLLDPEPGLQIKAPGALGPGGNGQGADLTTVPMLGIGSLGDYVVIADKQPPGQVSADEDIGIEPVPEIASTIILGGSNTDAAPTIVTLPDSSVPVMNQTIFEVDIASNGHVSEVVQPTIEQPGLTVITPGAGSLGDFVADKPVYKGSLGDFVADKPVYKGSLGDFAPVDTFPTLVQEGTSDNIWVDAHVKESIQRITNIRRSQGQPAPSAAYKARMAAEIRAANIDLPVYR